MISISTLIIATIIAIIVIPKALSQTEPVKKITIISEENLNYQKNDPGSWQITKSADWTSYGKARITFQVNTIRKGDKSKADILLVLDTSGSMRGEKLSHMKEDTIDLINTFFNYDGKQAALITFSDDSTILSGFTSDKDKLIDEINKISESGETNYYNALKSVDEVLRNYTPHEDKACLILFLTDGYPSLNTPNEVNQYNILKMKYPYISISGIQYEMGNNITSALANISDTPYAANIETLNYSLSSASVSRIPYTSFNITDYINNEYFEIESEDDIEANTGKVSLTEENGTQKVFWDIGKLGSGLRTSMTIDVTLKEKYLGKEGAYPTNIGESINTNIDGIEEDVKSELTPIIQSFYPVKYDGNAPNGCTVTGTPAQQNYMAFETVGLSDEIPKCNGYQFRGWKIVTPDVEKINDDYFIMPIKDVIIRAEWSKVAVEKSIDGEVYAGKELYNIIAKQGKLDTDIDFAASDLTTGVYEYSSTKENDYPVYYYRGSVTNNHVRFANQCWQIVRTTETGGVKLIYNGRPGSDGSCKNTGTASEITKSEYMINRNQDNFEANNAYLGYRTGTWAEPFGRGAFSVIMNEVNRWYNENTKKYDDRLEDTIWCNDRRLVSGGRSITDPAVYEGHNRLIDNRIDLTCALNDSYTVSEENGNGWLTESNFTYPAALLTLDELMLAGLGENSYLNTGETWWTMTVDRLVGASGSTPRQGFIFIASNGRADSAQIIDVHGVRPAVSLKPHIVVWDGDGSEEDPYIIE